MASLREVQRCPGPEPVLQLHAAGVRPGLRRDPGGLREELRGAALSLAPTAAARFDPPRSLATRLHRLDLEQLGPRPWGFEHCLMRALFDASIV